MVDVYQVVLGAIAVSIMVLVPIGLVLLCDLLAGRWDSSIGQWREFAGGRRRSAARTCGRCAISEVPLEQVAANLRRLAWGGDPRCPSIGGPPNG